ncbi:MAG: hypothetical protein QOD77_557 [Thermoplasmata archaeon]|jgi:hypothetical protein|nr:hypothetical protein [Thermoplasmata archaeon]
MRPAEPGRGAALVLLLMFAAFAGCTTTPDNPGEALAWLDEYAACDGDAPGECIAYPPEVAQSLDAAAFNPMGWRCFFSTAEPAFEWSLHHRLPALSGSTASPVAFEFDLGRQPIRGGYLVLEQASQRDVYNFSTSASNVAVVTDRGYEMTQPLTATVFVYDVSIEANLTAPIVHDRIYWRPTNPPSGVHEMRFQDKRFLLDEAHGNARVKHSFSVGPENSAIEVHVTPRIDHAPVTVATPLLRQCA